MTDIIFYRVHDIKKLIKSLEFEKSKLEIKVQRCSKLTSVTSSISLSVINVPLNLYVLLHSSHFISCY